MIALILTIAVLIAAFLFQKWNPALSGFIAVIPVKILGTGFMAFESAGILSLQKTIQGMLIGQFI